MSGRTERLDSARAPSETSAGRPGAGISPNYAAAPWPTIASSHTFGGFKRLESKPGTLAAHASTVTALRQALEAAGIEFIDENGGGPGVRMRKGRHKRG